LAFDENTDKAVNNISSDPEIKGNIYFEIFLLKIFSIDFSLHQAMGDTKGKGAIMNHLVIDFVTKVPDGNPMAFFNFVNQRQTEYSRALKTPHNLGPSFMIGKTFCEMISRKPDVSVAFLGSTIFAEMIVAIGGTIDNLLKKYKIKL
jgi:hypothetical protein